MKITYQTITLLICIYSSTFVFANDLTENEVQQFFDTCNQAFINKNLSEISNTLSKDYKYAVYYPEIKENPTIRLGYKGYIFVLESMFQPSTEVIKYNIEIQHIDIDQDTAVVEATMETSVDLYGKEIHVCDGPTLIVISKIDNEILVRTTTAIAYCKVTEDKTSNI